MLGGGTKKISEGLKVSYIWICAQVCTLGKIHQAVHTRPALSITINKENTCWT